MINPDNPDYDHSTNSLIGKADSANQAFRCICHYLGIFESNHHFPVDFLHFQAVVGIGTCELWCHSVETGKGCGSNNSHLAEEQGQCSMVDETLSLCSFLCSLLVETWLSYYRYRLWLWLFLIEIAVRLSHWLKPFLTTILTDFKDLHNLGGHLIDSAVQIKLDWSFSGQPDHDVATDSDRCKEHSLESLKAPTLLYQWFSFGVIQVVFFLGMATASDFFYPTWNSSWLACQKPCNKTQNSKPFGLFVRSILEYFHIFLYIFIYFLFFEYSNNPTVLIGFPEFQGLCLLGQVRRPRTALDLDWRLRFGAGRLQGPGLGWRCALGAPTAREVWNGWFLEMAQDLRKKTLHGNCMKFEILQIFKNRLVVTGCHFGWMNLNLPQDFTRCWLCMSFAW